MGRASTMATILAFVASLGACDGGRAENDAAHDTTAAPTMAASPSGPTPKASATGATLSPDETAAGKELTGFGATARGNLRWLSLGGGTQRSAQCG